MTRSRLAPIGLALAIAAAGLCACGKVGYLEQPAPLWGEKAKADFRARQAAHDAARATRDAGAPEPLPESLTPPEPGAATPLIATPPAPATPSADRAPQPSPPQ